MQPLALPSGPAQCGENVTLMLNSTPAADHSPIPYAGSQGYKKASIDLNIEVGNSSAISNR